MRSDKPDDRTILTVADPEFISELSEYLDVLASPVRLHILSFVGARSRTIRQISREIKTSYENTKKHLNRLLSLGLIRKDIGVSDELVNHGQPVFYYALVPGGLDRTISSLMVFSSVSDTVPAGFKERLLSARKGLQDILPSSGPRLTITNGPESGLQFNLSGEEYRIGRTEEGWDGMVVGPAIIFTDEYRSVSRVSRPHAWLRMLRGRWTIVEGTSKGGTRVNGIPVSKEPVLLKEGDMIELSPGPLGAVLLFQSEKT